MRENLYNIAHKTSNEKFCTGWDRTFKDHKGEDMRTKETVKSVSEAKVKDE